MAINIHSDHILRNLRSPGEIGYKIPQGNLIINWWCFTFWKSSRWTIRICIGCKFLWWNYRMVRLCDEVCIILSNFKWNVDYFHLIVLNHWLHLHLRYLRWVTSVREHCIIIGKQSGRRTINRIIYISDGTSKSLTTIRLVEKRSYRICSSSLSSMKGLDRWQI